MLLQNANRKDGGPVPSVFYAARVILLSWFANSVTWFRMGDAYRAYVYAEDTKSSFPRSMGTVLADRLVDLAIVAILMAVGIGVLLAGGQIRPPMLLVLIAVGLMARHRPRSGRNVRHRTLGNAALAAESAGHL